MGRVEEINGKAVVPGDTICVIEEFLPGPWTYVVDGAIKAAITGRVYVDIAMRTVSVRPTVKLFEVTMRGTYIYGYVVMVKDEFAIIKVVGSAHGTKYASTFTGLLHISQSSDKFIKNLYDVVRVGDIVKAKVLNDAPPFNLTFKEPRLGVILAFCGTCGHRLTKLSTDTLKCPICGNIEKRKVSIDYGNLKGL
ncbi:MAG: exosome complex RNA-binding protein Csl4 [Desulfurococcales archaeon]|nr:exosome complex RNA-binding protein Csl4 [Desulfurococcales archaeon]